MIYQILFITEQLSFSFLATSIAILNASLSSGFGDFTVEKSGSGISCSFTVIIFLKPASSSVLLTGIFPVPCIGVNTIFILLPYSSIIS